LIVKSTKPKQFSTFSKLLRAKQPVDSTKQQVVFHLVEKTHDSKKVLNHISFRFNKGVDHSSNTSLSSNTLDLVSSKHMITLVQHNPLLLDRQLC